jgi:hypothetical protein
MADRLHPGRWESIHSQSGGGGDVGGVNANYVWARWDGWKPLPPVGG